MNKTWFTSDFHFCHNRAFIYEPRGFTNVEEMNKKIIQNFSEVVDLDDDLYILGDIMLNDNARGIDLLKQLPGRKHIILGNHDTDARIALYKKCWNVDVLGYADIIKINGWHFYLSHYPTTTANFEEEFNKKVLINLFGHTHQKDNFYKDIPYMYHVGLDSHNCYPVEVTEILKDIELEINKCKNML